MVLAATARKLRLKTIYDRKISVLHKQDDRMNLSNISIQSELSEKIFIIMNIIKKRDKQKLK